MRVSVFSMVMAMSMLAASGAALAEPAPAADQTGPGVKADWAARHAAMHKEFCEDIVARQAARLAYLSTKLNLKDSQRASWDHYYQAEISGARSEQAACLRAAPHGDTMPTSIERQSKRIQMLQIRLQTLQNAEPALESFYKALSDDQKKIFDRPPHHRHMEMMRVADHQWGPKNHMKDHDE